MTDKSVEQLIREAYERNLTELDLSGRGLYELPPEIGKLEKLKKFDISQNMLTQLPNEIRKLKNLTSLNLSHNQLIKLPLEIIELKNLTQLFLYGNQLIQLPPEIKELKYLTILSLSGNPIVELPPEITELKSLTTLHLSGYQITHIPPEIMELKSLTTLYLSGTNLWELPSEIKELKNLSILSLSGSELHTELPSEIKELKNLTELYLSNNYLSSLPPEIGELKNLKKLDLSFNQLTKLPPEIKKLKNLTELHLSGIQLTQMSEICEFENLTILNLSKNYLTQLPPEIGKLKNLSVLKLSNNYLSELPPEIGELKSLKELNIYSNNIKKLPSKIGELNNLETFDLFNNYLSELPPEIGELKNITKINLNENQLKRLPPEIGELKNLITLNLSANKLTQLPPEITQLKNLTVLDLSTNQLTQLPPEITQLKNLTVLDLSTNQLTQLPPEFTQLKNLTVLDLSTNQLTQLPTEITQLKNLTALNLSTNQLTQLPPEITQLKNLTTLDLSDNYLTELPPEITELENLITLDLDRNPLNSPPPEIVATGVEAIFTYLKQSKTTENNEAKLILVGNGEVGKTCLAYRLINNTFLEDVMITEGINISKWSIPAPVYGHNDIKLNVWDFGGQEIYHATHQFFLTTRSVYLLVWNARKTKDYDNIYYWLHTIEAFGGDSPIILVMSKMNESDDDLNLEDLKNKFPRIKGYQKIDSKNGKGISVLKEKIREIAWSIPLMGAPWVDSWYRVREKLEGLGENWIQYNKFRKICVLEGLDDKNISILDGYLHELGVTLHFKDRIGLKDIVVLKPEWATNAFYKILSTKSVLQREGILLQSELDQIWNKEIYPSSVHSQLMELMNKFELSYELPDKKSYLIPELLPKSIHNLEWSEKNDLCFYYSYDYFLPPGIITRFIVQMHQDIKKKENGMPLCWREGAVLELLSSHAHIKMKPDEKQIEIRVKGDNKRGALNVICYQLDQINTSIKKIKVCKQIPCNCSENCPERYSYEDLLKAEIDNVKTIQCHKTFKFIHISSLLDGYKRREERLEEYNKISRRRGQTIIFSSTFNPVYSPSVQAKSDTKQIVKVEQRTDVKTDVKVDVYIDLKVDLLQIQTNFDNLRREIAKYNPELKGEMDEIQDNLDEVSADDEKDKLKKPFNKLRRFLVKLGDPDSEFNKVIAGTQKGTEIAQKVVETFNKVAPALGILALHGLL